MFKIFVSQIHYGFISLQSMGKQLTFFAPSAVPRGLGSNCTRHPHVRRAGILIWHNRIGIIVRVEENGFRRFGERMSALAAAHLLGGGGGRTATGAASMRRVLPRR